MRIVAISLLALSIAACNVGGDNHFIPKKPATDVDSGIRNIVLPLEVDISAAETFVRIGFGLDEHQKFQATEFRTPRLRTSQARHLIRLVKSYNEFDGEKVAQALAKFEGRVSGVEFGREGSPVLYIELPYWTHQREGTILSEKGVRVSDEENEKLVQELRDVFVSSLKADEFSTRKRTVRVWWD